MMGWGTPYRAVVLATVSLAVVGSFAMAQIAEDDGGARAIAGVSFRLELDDGDPEFRTGFDLDLISATRTQRLSFSGDFGLVVPLDDVEAADFDDPRYGINYLRDNGRSRITVGASIRLRDLDSEFVEDPDAPFDEETLTFVEGGSEERRSLNAAVELGLNDPIGAEIRFGFDERVFTDALDPDLQDNERYEAALALRYDVDGSLRLGASTQWTLEDEEPGLGSERDERVRAGIDVAWQIRPDIAVTGEIAYARIEVETETAVGFDVQDRDGINLRFGLNLDRPNGNLRFNLSRILNAPGFVSNADVTRNFGLANGAEVSVRLGAVELPNGTVSATGALSYDQEMRRGDLALSFSQTSALSGDFDAVDRRILSGSYSLDLPRDARLAITGRLTDSDFIDATEADIETARLGLNYRRPLTEDWSLNAGATWNLTREDGEPDDVDQRIFLTISRDFTLRY